MPELLGRREISLPQRGAKTNELIEKHVFYTDRNLTTLDRVSRHKRCLFRGYARLRDFITKIRRIILFTNTTLNRLGFGGTAIKLFHFRNNKTEDSLHGGAKGP